jgi:hypothetical protein
MLWGFPVELFGLVKENECAKSVKKTFKWHWIVQNAKE